MTILGADPAGRHVAATPMTAATMTRTATTATWPTTATDAVFSRRLPGGSVHRGLNLAGGGVALDAGFNTEKMSKQASETYRIITRSDGGDEGLVFGPQTGKHITKNFFIGERMTKGGHRVSMALHPLKVGGSSHVHLGGVGELVPNLHDLGTVLGGEHGVQRRPDDGSNSVLGHLAQYIFTHRCNQGVEDKLILSAPVKIVRVGDLTSSITSAFSEELGQHQNGAVDMAKELMRVKHKRLRLPKEEVIPSEPNGHGIPKDGTAIVVDEPVTLADGVETRAAVVEDMESGWEKRLDLGHLNQVAGILII
jgi:hypothetical protein